MNKSKNVINNIKIPLLFLAILMLISFIVYSILSISIKNFPACITFQFKISINSELNVKNELNSIFKSYNLKKISENENLVYLESTTQIVQWSSDIPYSVNACSKGKNLLEWTEMLDKIQNLLLKNDQNLRLYFHPASDSKDCKRRMQEGYLIVPTDFEKFSELIEC